MAGRSRHIQSRHSFASGVAAGLLSACAVMAAESTEAPAPAATAPEARRAAGFTTAEVASFDLPWAMTFLPDGRLLVTEMGGAVRLYDLCRQGDREHRRRAEGGPCRTGRAG
jgi:glucose/arabinose dehydrogenase